jgi:hypothetical protein
MQAKQPLPHTVAVPMPISVLDEDLSWLRGFDGLLQLLPLSFHFLNLMTEIDVKTLMFQGDSNTKN